MLSEDTPRGSPLCVKSSRVKNHPPKVKTLKVPPETDSNTSVATSGHCPIRRQHLLPMVFVATLFGDIMIQQNKSYARRRWPALRLRQRIGAPMGRTDIQHVNLGMITWFNVKFQRTESLDQAFRSNPFSRARTASTNATEKSPEIRLPDPASLSPHLISSRRSHPSRIIGQRPQIQRG